MSNGFQFYEGSTTDNTAARITVRKGGQIVLTRGAVEMLGDGVTHAQLGYNPKTGVVGIRAATKDDKGAYRLRTQGTNGLHLLTGKRFFAHHKITTDKARSFDPEKVEDGLIGFRVSEAPAEDKKARTDKPAAKAA